MGLLVMMSRDGAGGKTELSQHLMSAAAVAAAEDSGSSLGDSDSTQSLSSGGSTGWYAHWSDSSSDSSSGSGGNWKKELKVMQARQQARRAREDKKFFSGVDKAFGKQASNAMLAVLNGQGKNLLSKFKLNEKKLDEQKKKIADNTHIADSTLTPKTGKAKKLHEAHRKVAAKHAAASANEGGAAAHAKAALAKHDKAAAKSQVKAAPEAKQVEAAKAKKTKDEVVAETAAKLASKKIKPGDKTAQEEALEVAKKMAAHTQPAASTSKQGTKQDTHEEHEKSTQAGAVKAKEDASVVKEALKVAKKMSEHKDPVYKKAVHATTKPAAAAAKPAAAAGAHAASKVHKAVTYKSLQHEGIMAKSEKMQKLVHEFKHASGAKKKVLKARVMQLEQEIQQGTKAVDHFGERAKTAFARALAKEKGKKAAAHSGADSSSHRGAMSDAERLKADGWH
jgi:hypothetical protein